MRKLISILLLQSSLFSFSSPSIAKTIQTNYECLGLGKITFSVDANDYRRINQDIHKISGFISINGKSYSLFLFDISNDEIWKSSNGKIMFVRGLTTWVKIQSKEYQCAKTDNIISVKCKQGIVKAKEATYQKFDKDKWRDLTHNITDYSFQNNTSSIELETLYQIRCNK